MMSKPFLFVLGLPGVALFLTTVVVAAEEGGLPSLTTLIVPMLVILLLVLLNGLFVAAEIAIIGVRPSKLEQLVDEGDKTAVSILHTATSRDAQDRYIATAQLGITIASLGLAMYGEPQIAHFIEPYLMSWFPTITEGTINTVGFVTALSLMTYLHIVLGEMIPKSLALTDSVKMMMLLIKPMRYIQWVMRYPVSILNGIGRLLLKLFRVPPVEGHARILSPEEIELIVSESAEEGLLHEEEEEMIRNIFDFGERTVGQVLTPRRKVQAVPLDMPYETLLKLATESRHSRFPVYDGDLDHVMGMLHIKDLVRHSLKGQKTFDIRLYLRTMPAIPEDQPVEILLALFKSKRLHMGIVLDEFGGMAGIVTLEDLVEEIVGEVRDEFDQEKEPYIEIGPGVVELDGEFLVDDLIEDVVYLGEDALPDVETVGGLLISKLGRPPAVGDEVTYNNGRVIMRALAVEGRAVARMRVEFPAMEEKRKDEEETAVSPDSQPSTSDTQPNLIEKIQKRRKKWNLF